MAHMFSSRTQLLLQWRYAAASLAPCFLHPVAAQQVYTRMTAVPCKRITAATVRHPLSPLPTALRLAYTAYTVSINYSTKQMLRGHKELHGSSQLPAVTSTNSTAAVIYCISMNHSSAPWVQGASWQLPAVTYLWKGSPVTKWPTAHAATTATAGQNCAVRGCNTEW